MFLFIPKTEVYAAPPAPPVTHYEITGMADQSMFDEREFQPFQDNAVETDGAIYIETNQMGQGKVDITMDGISRNFQEIEVRL
ncbi:hypothetical protein [Clostridium estertheticum]|uniref:hypothetical protein n=1 Tax=Clostridium estertheticum TaxID=238834 RepID=UPI001CF3EACA|nr:hypothetical protein [Clostridium estertheticum]MCB2362354.1 hypothetical protein [Clostridium estertheticum]